jgi:hypothetical protein
VALTGFYLPFSRSAAAVGPGVDQHWEVPFLSLAAGWLCSLVLAGVRRGRGRGAFDGKGDVTTGCCCCAVNGKRKRREMDAAVSWFIIRKITLF